MAIEGFSSQPSPGNSNITVEPGTMSFEAMIKDIRYGLLVDQVLGGGQSNVLAGEFSVNIDLGYLIENGEIVGRVKDCMFAGNAFEVFNNIVAIGDKAEWHGSIKVPPFLLQVNKRRRKCRLIFLILEIVWKHGRRETEVAQEIYRVNPHNKGRMLQVPLRKRGFRGLVFF